MGRVSAGVCVCVESDGSDGSVDTAVDADVDTVLGRDVHSVEKTLRRWLAEVGCGRLSRRGFVERIASFGIGTPAAAALLLQAGTAPAQPAAAYAPTRRGGGGPLKLLVWQAPTLLNPHFASGTKDVEGSRLFYEPLTRWDADGNLQPVLAAELPSRSNRGIAADGRSVVWRLRQGVTWHDGRPFTADDVVFNWQYATNPAAAAVTLGSYAGLRLEKVDAHTVRVHFDRPTPFWAGTYCGVLLIPQHLFAAHAGARSREAPNNLRPVGTGPYRYVDFKPGDLVRGALNPAYHLPNRPHFDTVEMKGGGDAVSAARAVLQTGEYDYAWNLQVEDEVLARMEAGGKGRVVVLSSGMVESIQLQGADPVAVTDGERAHPRSRHPVWSDPIVRQAFGLLLDRAGIQRFIYGRTGVATDRYLNRPDRYRVARPAAPFDIDKANTLLDGAGWQRGADGVRAKGGRRLAFVFQTSTNGSRQKTQAIVKQACQKAGIAIEIKSVSAAVYFSSDVGNPDTFGKFWADIQMQTAEMGSPDPQRFMQAFTSAEISSRANKWLGLNRSRWRNDEYDRLFEASRSELDPVKRTALFIRLNDIVCADGYVHPLVNRAEVAAVGLRMVAPLSGWDSAMSAIHDWHRTG